MIENLIELDKLAENKFPGMLSTELKGQFYQESKHGCGSFRIQGNYKSQSLEYWIHSDHIRLGLTKDNNILKINYEKNKITSVSINDRDYYDNSDSFGDSFSKVMSGTLNIVKELSDKVDGKYLEQEYKEKSDIEEKRVPSEADEEREQALVFGKKVFDTIKDHLNKTNPDAMKFIKDYYQRNLVVPECAMRTNEEIFRNFDI